MGVRWVVVLAVVLGVSLAGGAPWLEFGPTDETPADAPGRGLHVVLVSGDEEYRSEEALPQLAAILSGRHGFRCTVLFSIDAETGVVNPDNRGNIPGLAHLRDADCLVLFTRFRDLPDDQMAEIDAYLKTGGPVLGIRTSTHAFNIGEGKKYSRYSWRYAGDADPDAPDDAEAKVWEQGFGRFVLGETWIAHHGGHGTESTRGVVAPGAAAHPIARGLGSPDEPLPGLAGIWGDTDVYRVRLPMLEGVEPIVLGQVLAGMDPNDEPVDGEKNDPLMPIAWTKPYRLPGGEPGVSFTSTLGAATDLVAEGSRRMLVNAVYWLCGLGESIPAGGTDARVVGAFDPTKFGFGDARKGLKPEAFAPPGSISAAEPVDGLRLEDGDRVVLIGNTFAEHLAKSGYFAAMVHAAHPGIDVSVRHIPWSADEVGRQPREMNVPGTMARLDELDATVIVACYGMGESFAGEAGLARFESDLAEFLLELGSTEFAPGRTPRVALVSPIEHEDLGTPWVTGEALAARNRDIALYTEVMRSQAARAEAAFVDLFSLRKLENGRAVTFNGLHPVESASRGYSATIAHALGWFPSIGSAPTAAEQAAADEYRRLAWDLFYHERLWYRPTNTEYVYGRRHKPYGIVNFPPEIEQLERMIDARDRALQSRPRPSLDALLRVRADSDAPPVWEHVPTSRDFPEDEWTPDPVVAKGTETSLGDTEIASPEVFIDGFVVADGYAVECFASEREFPEIASPLAMAFDEEHRLWLLCAQTYPHLLPGERPRCKLVVLEDTDGDGAADVSTVFADRLYIPTGFAVDTDAVYLGQAPELVKLSDTDGDGVADRREVLLTGFAMPDSHHSLSAFEWDPHGGILMHEGVFCVTGVETPWGTQRSRDAAVWRYDTRTGRLTRLSHTSFANPWGHAFDGFGQSVLADASGGSNYSFGHVISGTVMDRRGRRGGQILNRGRPTAGCEILASRHFPEDVQGTFLVNQSIGFHGTRWNRLTEPAGDASAWSAEAMPQDLISSPDVNFRPVAMETGPDGALYLADWCNPIIGHMQYSVRDPRRDSTHGRVWRVRHARRDLVEPPAIPAGGTEGERAELLELLRLPETNTRHHVRRRLQRAPTDEVLPEAERWVEGLPESDPDRERLLLELLWLHRAHGAVDLGLLERVASAGDARVRAGAMRVLRHWLDEGVAPSGDALGILLEAGSDPDMRVRLEAVVASGFADTADALVIAETVSGLPYDDAMRVAIEETVIFLGRHGGEAPEFARRLELERMPGDRLVALPAGAMRDRVVLGRPDTPIEARAEAMGRIAEADGPGAVARLALDGGDRAAVSVAELLPMMSDEDLRAARPAWLDLVDAGGDAGGLGLAALLRMGEPLPGSAGGDPGMLLRAAEMLPPGGLPSAAFDVLQEEAGASGSSMTRLVEALTRHAVTVEARAALRDRLQTSWVDPVRTVPLIDWGPAHERAVAGLRGLALLDDTEGAVVPLADPVQMELGAGVYHSESVGCVRCHADDGSGLEGFPPLAGSAWVHGRPERMIAAVLHGLQGELEVPGGGRYNSAMAPLGGLIDDERTAAVVTYVRQSFGNFASPVPESLVSEVRGTRGPAEGPWRASALLAAYPLTASSVVPGVEPDAPAVAPVGGRVVEPGEPTGVGRGALTAGVFAVLVLAVLVLGVAAIWLYRRA